MGTRELIVMACLIGVLAALLVSSYIRAKKVEKIVESSLLEK